MAGGGLHAGEAPDLAPSPLLCRDRPEARALRGCQDRGHRRPHRAPHRGWVCPPRAAPAHLARLCCGLDLQHSNGAGPCIMPSPRPACRPPRHLPPLPNPHPAHRGAVWRPGGRRTAPPCSRCGLDSPRRVLEESSSWRLHVPPGAPAAAAAGHTAPLCLFARPPACLPACLQGRCPPLRPGRRGARRTPRAPPRCTTCGA